VFSNFAEKIIFPTLYHLNFQLLLHVAHRLGRIVTRKMLLKFPILVRAIPREKSRLRLEPKNIYYHLSFAGGR